MSNEKNYNSVSIWICLIAAAAFFLFMYFRGAVPIGPKPEKYSFHCLESELYTYDEMAQDMETLKKKYGDMVRIDTLTETEDGRKVFDVRVGSGSAPHRILVNGAIHGREYITSRLVMCQVLDILEGAKSEKTYEGAEIPEILRQTEIHFVPMLNPDGVTISQLGLKGIHSSKVKEKIKAIAELDGKEASGDYLVQWKSNANGVDLNRNFDALWDSYDDGVYHPSSNKYKGKSFECEAESAAAADLIRDQKFSAVLCYHTQGEMIYWYFRQKGTLRAKTEQFADKLSGLTGYPADSDHQALDPAGLKDWALEKEGIPGYTIEVGKGDHPVDPKQFEKIRKQNQYVVPETALAAAEGRLEQIRPGELRPGDILTVVNCNEYITLRAKPSTKADALDRIPLGETVTYEATENDDFYKITYQGQTGYSLIDYLE